MAARPDQVTLRQVGGAWVLALPSELRAEVEDALLPESERALATTPQLLVLDFSRVSFTNSAGIGVLVDLLRRAAERSVRVALVAVSGQPRLIVDRIGLARYAPLYASVDDAIAGAHRP